jgi:hypothetical protein
MVSDFRHAHPLRGLRPILAFAMAALWILFPVAFDSAAQQTLHHDLEVEILHDAKTLRGIDTLRLPRGVSRIRMVFHPGVRMLDVRDATYTKKPVGKSGDLQVGQTVLAIGNPFGLSRTLTTGAISAPDRRLPAATGG